MTQDIKDEFGKGNSISQTRERTRFRSVRRLRERHLLRRERLHRVLQTLGFLPLHYGEQIDFKKRLGQFLVETEPKLAWKKNEKAGFTFLFKNSFEEMINEFKANGCETKIPHDWTIYYLRKKALSQKIEKEELAWLIMNFNQKRGYYQLRGEEEDENKNKSVEFHSLRIVKVVADEKPNNKGEIWYSLHLENGWTYRRSSKIPLFDWENKIRDFIVTTDLNDDGSVKTDKEGVEKRSFRAPGEDDWTLIKKKTEQEIDSSHKTVGSFIYDALLQNPKQKIKGKLVRTIERKFYKNELIAILEKQIELQPGLFSDDLYNDCVRELYRNNEVHQTILSKRDFVHLIIEDLIFYQRPLRSQKSTISNCTLEYRTFKTTDKEGNEISKKEYLKAIPKSHPLYQEFRLWQWIYNLSIHKKDNDENVTGQFISSADNYEQLFDFLYERKEIKQEQLIEFLLKIKLDIKKVPKTEVAKYRWNFVEDKVYPMNETGTQIRTRLAKVENVPTNFLTYEIEQKLWHIIYSVNDKIQYEKALKTFANKHALDEVSFIDNFKKFPPFKSDYGSFSEKAIRKLLPLLRLGKYWSWDAIDDKTKERIGRIITGEFDETIKNRVREKAIHLTNEVNFQGLQLWLAQYVIYDRHSEANIAGKWSSVADLEKYLHEFKQHSLRNPIVEQVVTESLRVVKDIWIKFGKGANDFLNEIHIELGREMKNTAEDRKRITNQVTENENTNLRIKALLAELQNDAQVENVRPYSPMQQEALKIYEDGVLSSDIEIPDDILKISKSPLPTLSELQRYKLWLEQKYRSPYTGEIIPLNKLFTPEYEIEHIIPQSRYFDDSFNNKVICESAINKLKDKQLGYEFIKNHHGRIVETGFGRNIKVFDEDAYQTFVKEHYSKNRSKRNKLLLDEIPDKMIERQLNDTRYISKFISNVLSNIVREENNDDGLNSINVLPGNGKITSMLRQDWGLDSVWNDLILPRFERMNQLTNRKDFTSWNEKYQKFLPTVPLELSKGFQKKRIDHRHHAVDALVIACATRDHINLLNNQSAKSGNSRYDLQNKLRNKVKWTDNDGKQRDKFTEFKKPWDNFTKDTKDELEKMVVSFKQNLRVINKATNHYEKIENGKKVKVKQEGANWAIRQSLHEETVSGIVRLSWVEVGNNEITTATRKYLDKSFNLEKIKKITDTGIQKILENYLIQEKFKIINEKGEVSYNTEVAFSPEGIEELNKNISQYNNDKFHQPIFKVRVYEKGSGRFKLGIKGNNKDKYVQGSPNLFFALYSNKQQLCKGADKKPTNRCFETIPLNIVIERQKQNLKPVPEKNEMGEELIFHLSPDDLVYMPTGDEQENANPIDFNNLTKEQMKRIFFVNDFSGTTCYFRPNCIAKAIVSKEVDMSYDEKKNKVTGSFDVKTASLDGKQIKDVCIKLKIDRLGNISKEDYE